MVRGKGRLQLQDYIYAAFHWFLFLFSYHKEKIIFFLLQNINT